MATGVTMTSLDTTGLCLLSLDGGGVRGLSTLYILQVIMKRLNHERSKLGLKPTKPCEVFDLIGGTSTGGLIAIMLGRLEMDVDECISSYNDLMSEIFSNKQHALAINWRGNIQPRFQSTKLSGAIERVIRSRGLSPTDLLNDGNARGCRVFVCTVAKEITSVERLRSYESALRPTFVEPTILQAALATSAATGIFEPVVIGSQTFIDGALRANNPIFEVESEATDLWASANEDIKSLVKCIVSIGTGQSDMRAVEDKLTGFIPTLVSIATETEATARSFIDRWRSHYSEDRYFRFNVEQGLHDVGLVEYQYQGKIAAATQQYITDQSRVNSVASCANNLKQKQKKAGAQLAQFLGHPTTLSTKVESRVFHIQKSMIDAQLLDIKETIQTSALDSILHMEKLFNSLHDERNPRARSRESNNTKQTYSSTSTQSSANTASKQSLGQMIDHICGLFNQPQLCIDTYSDLDEPTNAILDDIRAILKLLRTQQTMETQLRQRFCSTECQLDFFQHARSGIQRLEQGFGQMELYINKLKLHHPLPTTPIRQKRTLCEFDTDIGTLTFTMNKRQRSTNYLHITNDKKSDYTLSLSFLPKKASQLHMFVISTLQQQLTNQSISCASKLVVNRVLPCDSKVFKIVKEGKLQEFRELLSNGMGAATLRDYDEYGSSLLFYATDQPEMCRFLIESGLDVDEIGDYRSIGHDYDSKIPMSILQVQSNDFEMQMDELQRVVQCRRLLLNAGADPTINLSSGYAPSFIESTIYNKDEATFSLLNQTEWLWFFIDRMDFRNLSEFCGDYEPGFSKERFSWLLRAGSDIHARNACMETCLHACLLNIDEVRPSQHHDALLYLLENGADPHLVNSSGLTASDIAYRSIHFCDGTQSEHVYTGNGDSNDGDSDDGDSDDGSPCDDCGDEDCKQGGYINFGSYIMDLWESVLHSHGLDIGEMRGKYQRKTIFSYGFMHRNYSRECFEELWKGKEDECPYWHEPPAQVILAHEYRGCCLCENPV